MSCAILRLAVWWDSGVFEVDCDGVQRVAFCFEGWEEVEFRYPLDWWCVGMIEGSRERRIYSTALSRTKEQVFAKDEVDCPW